MWLTLNGFMFFVLTHVSHLSIFSTSSSRDCWNLLLTVGAWYFLVTVLLFRTCPPLCWTMTSAWTTKRFETIWTQTKVLAHERLHLFFLLKDFVAFMLLFFHLVLALDEEVQDILPHLIKVLVMELVNLFCWHPRLFLRKEKHHMAARLKSTTRMKTLF